MLEATRKGDAHLSCGNYFLVEEGTENEQSHTWPPLHPGSDVSNPGGCVVVCFRLHSITSLGVLKDRTLKPMGRELQPSLELFQT